MLRRALRFPLRPTLTRVNPTLFPPLRLVHAQVLPEDTPSWHEAPVCSLIVEGQRVACTGLGITDLLKLTAPALSSSSLPSPSPSPSSAYPLLAAASFSQLIEEESGMELSRTYRPHFKKRKRVHGFLTRLRSKSGRRILERRRAKGKKDLAV